MMTRRRFLTISAAFLSGPAHSATLQEWSGPVLGTSGRILLSGASPLVARQVFAKVERTLRQVESQFSLYREFEPGAPQPHWLVGLSRSRNAEGV